MQKVIMCSGNYGTADMEGEIIGTIYAVEEHIWADKEVGVAREIFSSLREEMQSLFSEYLRITGINNGGEPDITNTHAIYENDLGFVKLYITVHEAKEVQ